MPILWQHLFWWFGHPEVYILILPFFGIITDVIAVFARRPVFRYQALVHAMLAIAALSMGVWAHHMFATGASAAALLQRLSLLIAVPTGVKFFSWIGTMWGPDQLRLPDAVQPGLPLHVRAGRTVRGPAGVTPWTSTSAATSS